MRTEHDAMGQALRDALDGCPKTLVIERDDGLAEADHEVPHYVTAYDAWPEPERAAMEWVRGRVLDVGAGAGRHALHLQECGHDVVGIDASAGAIEVCRRRGLRDARRLSARRIGPKLGVFDTVIMMGNNFGLMESREFARRLLPRLAAMTSAQGRIVASTLNVYRTSDPDHLAYLELNRKHGRMPGQLRLRLRYRKLKSPWFDYLMVSPDELRELAQGTGWEVTDLLGEPDRGLYFALLEKKEPAALPKESVNINVSTSSKSTTGHD